MTTSYEHSGWWKAEGWVDVADVDKGVDVMVRLAVQWRFSSS